MCPLTIFRALSPQDESVAKEIEAGLNKVLNYATECQNKKINQIFIPEAVEITGNFNDTTAARAVISFNCGASAMSLEQWFKGTGGGPEGKEGEEESELGKPLSMGQKLLPCGHYPWEVQRIFSQLLQVRPSLHPSFVARPDQPTLTYPL